MNSKYNNIKVVLKPILIKKLRSYKTLVPVEQMDLIIHKLSEDNKIRFLHATQMSLLSHITKNGLKFSLVKLINLVEEYSNRVSTQRRFFRLYGEQRVEFYILTTN